MYSIHSGHSARTLAHSLEDYLTLKERMRCRVLRAENGDYIVQARDADGQAAHWTGLNRGVSVRFSMVEGNSVTVIITQAPCMPGHCLLVLCLPFNWGVAFTSLYGLLRQRHLIVRICRWLRLSTDSRHIEQSL